MISCIRIERNADRRHAVLTDGGTLTGGDVLPGFDVAVADVLPPRA